MLAALFLAARLLASSMVMAVPAQSPTADLVAQLSVFCHGGGDAGGTEKAPSSDHDCLICPACHLMAHAGLPTPMPAALPIRLGGMIMLATAPPAATGPPHQPRVADHPTGPPNISV